MDFENFDKDFLESIGTSYRKLCQEINKLGENETVISNPELIRRREALESYIVNFSQLFVKGLAYADQMKIEDVLSYALSKEAVHL